MLSCLCVAGADFEGHERGGPERGGKPWGLHLTGGACPAAGRLAAECCQVVQSNEQLTTEFCAHMMPVSDGEGYDQLLYH